MVTLKPPLMKSLGVALTTGTLERVLVKLMCLVVEPARMVAVPALSELKVTSPLKLVLPPTTKLPPMVRSPLISMALALARVI